MVYNQTYYGVHLDHVNEIWGGNTYQKVLVQDYPFEELVSTPSTAASTVDFLYPHLIKNRYYLDGVAEGHFTVYNSHATNNMTVTAYTVTLLKTDDVPSNTETIGGYSNSISSNNVVAAKNFLSLPVFMNISKGFVDENQKLILRINVTSSDGTLCICHDNDSVYEDVKIILPFMNV